MLLTDIPLVTVFIALPPKTTLLNVDTPVRACAAPLKITVAVEGLKVPLLDHAPLTVKSTGFWGSIVREAPACIVRLFTAAAAVVRDEIVG